MAKFDLQLANGIFGSEIFAGVRLELSAPDRRTGEQHVKLCIPSEARQEASEIASKLRTQYQVESKSRPGKEKSVQVDKATGEKFIILTKDEVVSICSQSGYSLDGDHDTDAQQASGSSSGPKGPGKFQLFGRSPGGQKEGKVFLKDDFDSSGYNDKQMGIFNFASNCCSFPKLVVHIVCNENNEYDDPNAVSKAINMLDNGTNVSLTEEQVIAVMEQGKALRS